MHRLRWQRCWLQGREEGWLSPISSGYKHREDFRYNRFFYWWSTDLIRSFPSLSPERMSAVFSCGVARCLRNTESCILRCKEPGCVAGFGGTGIPLWCWSQKQGREAKLCLRLNINSLGLESSSPPGLGEERRGQPTASCLGPPGLCPGQMVLPRSNGSPSAYRSGVFFLFDISVNKVAIDHTREASEGFRISPGPLARVCPSGLPARQLQGGGGDSGRACLPGVWTELGGHGDHGCCPSRFVCTADTGGAPQMWLSHPEARLGDTGKEGRWGKAALQCERGCETQAPRTLSGWYPNTPGGKLIFLPP